MQRLSNPKVAPSISFLAVLILPVAVTSSLVVIGYTIFTAGLIATACQFLALGWMELYFRDSYQEASFHSYSFWQDAVHGGLMLTVVKLLEPAVDRLLVPVAVELWPTDLSEFYQIVLYLVIVDLFEYWRHRLLHRIDWLWPIHAIHHAVPNLFVSRKHRFHFLEVVIRSFFIVAPLSLVGAPFELGVFYVLSLNFIGYPAHSSVNWQLPQWAHSTLVTPDVHHLHHDKRRNIHDANYGALLTLWDRVFGTFIHPQKVEVVEYGLEDFSSLQGIYAQLSYPFTMFGKNLKRTLAIKAK